MSDSQFDELFQTPGPRVRSTSRDREPAPPARQDKPKLGRPPSKRSNPGFRAMTHILNVETYEACLIALRQKELKPDFSDFLNDLMAKWLKSQTAVLPKT